MGVGNRGVCGTIPLMLIVALSHPDLPVGGRYGGIVTGPGGIASSKGGMFQMEIPGRGGTYPDIPPLEVLKSGHSTRGGGPHIPESAP